MWARVCSFFRELFYPPPVTWDDVEYVSACIDSIDRDIEYVRVEQRNTKDVYMFASMEYQIQYLLQRRIQLSVQRQDLLVRARRQGPLVSTELYSKIQ
jgi:hypothetical protein